MSKASRMVMLNLFQHQVPFKMLLKIKGVGFRNKFGMTALRLFVKKGKEIFLT